MKDKATYAGTLCDIYIIIDILVCERDFTFYSIFRDSQRQRHLWRWRILLLLRLMLLMVEMAAGTSPAVLAPVRTPVWPHRTG